LEDLHFFVLSDIWKGNPKIRNAILIRYDQLDPGQKHKDQFGTTEFWEADPMEKFEVIDDMVPDGYTVVDEWNEGKLYTMHFSLTYTVTVLYELQVMKNPGCLKTTTDKLVARLRSLMNQFQT